MRTHSASRQVLHVSDSPNESELLRLELSRADFEFQLARVDDPRALEIALNEHAADVIVADLPLPWPSAHDELALIQRTRPEIEVIFRWGDPGARSVEGESAQLERALRHTLSLRETQPQNEDERRAQLRELVRRQEIMLGIQRLPCWDFELVLRETTRATAQALRVERVSVWEFTADRTRLVCAMSFTLSTGEYQYGQALEAYPRYFHALESALSIAAHDARRDPRTSEFAASYLEPLGIRSMLDAPIRLDGAVAAVLCIEHVGEARHWSVLDQSAASNMACYLARAFEIRRRRIAEHRLRTSEHLNALGQLAGQIAHDFDRRLAALRGWIDLLAHDVEPGSPAEHCARQIALEVDHAAARVRELLQVAGSQSRASRGPIDLVAAIRAQAPTLQRVLGDGVGLEVSAPDEPVPVALGARELEATLLNLCANARDALQLGGQVRICVRPAADRERALLRVEDDDPGFSADVLPHLFEPLFTTKPVGRGAGLGLASIRSLLAEIGGDIEARNREPHGAQFDLELPLAHAAR